MLNQFRLIILNMELLFFAVAFACGFSIYQLKLPPLIGFLMAGFILNLMGHQTTNLLTQLADLGVTILLFSIGLKLKFGNLVKPQVWGPATLHIVLSTAFFASLLLLLCAASLPLFSALDTSSALLVGFAFSFSSTVFAVKVLEERGEMSALHGKIAI